MSLSIDDRRFLRRHNPTFAPSTSDFTVVDAAVAGETIALRSDGVVFYRPNHNAEEVWVAWLAKGPNLKSSPATRRVCSLDEYNEEISIARAAIADLLGS